MSRTRRSTTSAGLISDNADMAGAATRLAKVGKTASVTQACRSGLEHAKSVKNTPSDWLSVGSSAVSGLNQSSNRREISRPERSRLKMKSFATPTPAAVRRSASY